MSLDPRNNPVAVVTALASLIGLGLAFRMGQAAANNQFSFIALVFGAGLAILVVFSFREMIWVLVPLCWSLTGRMGGLPLPFSVRELAVLAAFGTFIAMVAMKQHRSPPNRRNYLDLLVWINVAMIAIMWLRNPVGVAAFGADTVGGRPYLSVAVALMAFLVLRNSVLTPKINTWLPFLFFGLAIFNSILGTLTYIFPGLTPFIHPIYSGINVGSYMAEEFGSGAAPVTLQEGRFSDLGGIGLCIFLLVIAYTSPQRAMSPMNPKYFFLLCLATLLVGLSGFRNLLFQAILIMLVASYLWDRGIGLFKTMTLGAVAVALLVGAQFVVELPRSIQRSLSFLPGNWDERVKEGARNSTDWRMNMWITALTDKRYINNKILGDGFGFSRTELELMLSAATGGTGYIGVNAGEEIFMVQGSYHSGPVSTIRFAGIVGLVLILALMIANAVFATRLLKRGWDSPFRPMLLILSTMCIIKPLFFVIVFGDYRHDLPDVMFNAGMLKLLDGALRMHEGRQKAQAPLPSLPQKPQLIPA